MTKAEIISEIRRIAAESGGKAPGTARMTREIGLRKATWYPKFWARWGDAVREAGLTPNARSVATPDEVLIRQHIELIREVGRFPIDSDLKLKRLRNEGRLGRRDDRVRRILAYCQSHAGLEDVASICEAALAESASEQDAPPLNDLRMAGYVYMIRHGRRAEFKIGRTNNPVRREGEFRLELPEQLEPVHYIKTDDAAGVERYWHERFAKQRMGGEFFALSAADVQAFKRWKRIY